MNRIGRQAVALALAWSLCVLSCVTASGPGNPNTDPGPGSSIPKPAQHPNGGSIVPGMPVDPIPLPGPPVLSDEAAAAGLRERWGIEIVGIRPTAAGTMLDFRYRVIDPDRALPLLDRTRKATLVIESSGEELAVPIPPKVGPMRQTVRYEEATSGRIYFIFFANPGRRVTAGEKVSVVIGDFRVEHLIVQ